MTKLRPHESQKKKQRGTKKEQRQQKWIETQVKRFENEKQKFLDLLVAAAEQGMNSATVMALDTTGEFSQCIKDEDSFRS